MMHHPPDDDDRRWRDFADVHARGDFLEPGERRFLETHVPEDEALAVEQRLYRAMRAAGDREDDSRADERLVAAAVDAWTDAPDGPTRMRRRQWWAAAGGVAVAAGLAAAVFVGGASEDHVATALPNAEEHDSAVVEPLSKVATDGQTSPATIRGVATGPRWVTAGDDPPGREVLDQGAMVEVSGKETCLLRSDAARVCMSRGAKARMGDAGTLEVVTGQAKVEASVGIFEIRVAGTAIHLEEGAFDVRVERDRWVIDVHSGRVELVDPAGVSTRLGPGDELVRGLPRRTRKAPAPTLDPADALGRARELRGAGDHEGAAKVLEQLVRQQPRTSAAGTALVLLGQIYLGPLDRPDRALANFERYLSRGGSLAPEAMYGAVNALRRLGRTDDARRAADRLRAEYPDSTYAGALSDQ